MIQPEFDPLFVEDIVRDLWETTRVHQSLLDGEQFPVWEELTETHQIALCRAMTEMLGVLQPRHQRRFRPR